MSVFEANLPLPPRLKKDTLRVVPLGGLGEVGRNMTVYEINGKLLIVDCGVLFPEESQPGVDLILPDFNYIVDRLDDVVAMVLTHGHEDHIGAVPYLLRRRPDIPLVGSELTLALVEAKLAEHRIKPYTLAVKEHQVERFGPFECEFVAVNHSIPDALAVFIRTQAGKVLHTGDFKMDQLPDSTNAEVPGFTPTEKNIGPVLSNVFRDARGRIIVASFSSHVHRVQQVLNAAAERGRKVVLVGRSMVRNMTIAEKLGYLKVPDNVLVDLKKVDDYRPDQIVMMCTGSQGEPMAALSRMANGDHKIQIEPGDTVVLASSLIPGNETSVYRIINALMKLGAHVVHKGNAKVHVSGHAAAGELLYCYNILKPKNVMPVHGEVRHLIANGDLAIETGIPAQNVLLCESGTVVDLRDGVATVVGEIPCEYLYVDGRSVGEVTESDLKDRRILGEEGFVSIVTAIDRATKRVVTGPDIHARGIAEDDAVFDEIVPKITAALEDALHRAPEKVHTVQQLQQIVRRTIGAWISRRLRRKPMIVPVVIEGASPDAKN